MKFNVFALVCFLMFSCGSGADSKMVTVRPEQLHGQWRNVYMKLEMKSYKDSDSAKTVIVTEDTWEKIMGIKPIRTYFWYNGKYNSAHYDLRDSLVYNPAGKWILRDDSLIMTDTFPKPGLQYRYKLAINGNMAEFWGIEDLDGDGKADDLYYGTQRKFR
jgi:hypothetical protein